MSSATDAVKLVHADDLRRWERFPRWQDFDGITFAHYRDEVRRLKRRRKAVARFIDARAELDRIDGDHVVDYETTSVDVPRSLTRRTRRIELPESPRPGTWVESSEGEVRDGVLEVPSGWRERWAVLTYKGPSKLVEAERIEELRRRLDAMSGEQRQAVEEVTTSRFAQPVLFISHRWADEAHPDPSGEQLRRLRTLEDCFVVYDYTSFPQLPRSQREEVEFRRILGAMDELIANVVVLEADDYLTRGWCLYEYVVSSLRGTTVCDELHDARFETLRDWAATPAPVSLSFRDSFESRQQNFIDERILASVNEVLPLYRDAAFQYEDDREIVTRLLVEHLERTLPPMKEHQEYLGEWKTVAWTDEALEPFFRGEAEPPGLQTLGLDRFRTAVPSQLRDAVDGGYAINRPDPLSLLNPLDSLRRFRF